MIRGGCNGNNKDTNDFLGACSLFLENLLHNMVNLLAVFSCLPVAWRERMRGRHLFDVRILVRYVWFCSSSDVI